jgi:AraC-like DNA-binding protein
MGNTLNSVEHLGEPFRSVDEQVFVIPRDGCNTVANQLFKLVFMLQGACRHEVDTEGPVRLEVGDVLVIPRVCQQRYWALPGDTARRIHALRLVLDPDRVPPLADGRRPVVRSDAEMDFAAFVRHHLREVRHLPLGADDVCRFLLAELRQEAEQRQPGYRFRVTALCTSLVVHVVRQLGEAKPEASPQSPGRSYLVLQAKEYLLKNLSADLHLNHVARHLRISPEHLARTFKEETGQTVFTYLQHLRLEKAKTYLIGSDRSIAAIAGMTGFGSLSLFSRNFKRYVGASPLAYRKGRWDQAKEESNPMTGR